MAGGQGTIREESWGTGRGQEGRQVTGTGGGQRDRL